MIMRRGVRSQPRVPAMSLPRLIDLYGRKVLLNNFIAQSLLNSDFLTQMPPLPVDIVVEILGYLEWRDVLRLRQVGFNDTI